MEAVSPLFDEEVDENLESGVSTPLGENSEQERYDALADLMGIMEELIQLSQQAKDIMQNYFPEEYRSAEAYGALDFGTSKNPYDTTFNQIIQDLESDFDENEEY